MSHRGFSDVPKHQIKAVKAEAMRIAGELREARHERAITQEELAEIAETSARMIGLVETGKRIPSLPMLIRICRALGLRVEILD